MYILDKKILGGNMYANLDNFEIKEKSEKEKQRDFIRSILKTKMDLNVSIRNYEFAEEDLIDYYLYQIKANQSKLDYLIKKAKEHNIAFSTIDKLKYDA